MTSSQDEDREADMSSLYAQATAHESTSIRGGISDWGDSVLSVSSTPPGAGNALRPRIMLDEFDVDRVTSIVDVDGECKASSSSSRPVARRKLLRWWSHVLSRLSRSASSLLNQHSPNLNDLLEGHDNGLNPIEDEEEPQTTCGRHGDKNGEIFAKESAANDEVCRLRAEVDSLNERIRHLEQQRTGCSVDNVDRTLSTNDVPPRIDTQIDIPTLTPIQTLQPQQISRYSRQLLLADGFGIAGQNKLLSSSVLVVGAGGIGSTVLMYLAASGVGHITIVDYDHVEMSNLHRQIIHRDHHSSYTNERVGINKAQSAKASMLALNPTISIAALDVMIDANNVMDLVSRHHVVVDASDNPRTRYLLNDACIFADKTLVSGSAMGTEGQLTVYNHQCVDDLDGKPTKTACYRCLYPNSNPAEGCKSCSDNGVLGPVPGLIGVLQAVEVIKVLTGIGKVMHDRLLMYDSLPCSFINIKKPPPKQNCAICSPQATIKSIHDSEQSLQNARGPTVCTMPNHNSTLSQDQRISCIDYHKLRKTGLPHILLDVRVTRQYDMCSLDGAINIPLEELEANLDKVDKLSNSALPVYCLCRRGIASVEATRIIQRSIEEGTCKKIHSVFNIDGGLNSWTKTVDSEFPWY